jgi:hypothetical protein
LKLRSITIAGVRLADQEIGLVDGAHWFGDGISSGILGLALPIETSAYDLLMSPIVYDPIVSTMKNKKLASSFSLGISRNDKDSFISFGGLPDIQIIWWSTSHWHC